MHKQIFAINYLVKIANIWSTGIFYKSMDGSPLRSAAGRGHVPRGETEVEVKQCNILYY